MHLLFFDTSKFNLGISALSSYIKKSDLYTDKLINKISLFHAENTYFQQSSKSKSIERTVDLILEKKPNAVAFSVFSHDFLYMKKISNCIRKKSNRKIITIAGGIHPTLAPIETFKSDAFDFVIIGEGEKPFYYLLSSIIRKNKCYDSISNLVYRDSDGKVQKNLIKSETDDLDTLPLADYDLYLDNYFGIFPYISSRGCPFSCSYCSNNALKKAYDTPTRLRRMSVNRVVHDLVKLKKKYKVKRIVFFDDDFCFNEKWLQEFSSQYKKEISIPFKIFTHPHSLNEKKIKLLKFCQCEGIYLGIQTFNEDIRKEICKRNENNEEISKICSMLKKHEIRVTVELIMGLPTETTNLIKNKLIYAKSLEAYHFSIYWLTFFPYTEIIDIAIGNDMINKQTKNEINSGLNTGITSALGSLQKYNRQFIPCAIFLTVIPLLSRRTVEFLINKNICDYVPKFFFMLPVIQSFKALVSRDIYQLTEIKKYYHNKLKKIFPRISLK